jgi:hypothetical protein
MWFLHTWELLLSALGRVGVCCQRGRKSAAGVGGTWNTSVQVRYKCLLRLRAFFYCQRVPWSVQVLTEPEHGRGSRVAEQLYALPLYLHLAAPATINMHKL